MTALGSSRASKNAASPIAGAVFRADGLGDDLLLLQLLQLANDRVAQIFVGDDPELLRLGQRLQALDRLLDHALLAVERQQLLGHALAAQRPEARAASTGENDGIKVEAF